MNTPYTDWAANGHGLKQRGVNVITSLELDPAKMEEKNHKLQEKYRQIRENEVRYETKDLEDAELAIVAFGSAARISQKAIEIAREQGIKVGLFRPITLWPFPQEEIAELSGSGRRQAGHYQNYIEIYRQQGSGYHRSSQSFQAGSADLFQLCRYAEGKKGSGYCDRFYF